VSRDEAAEMRAAYESLFNGKPPAVDGSDGSGGSPWPDARPYVIVWCPHRTRRCRVGAVYATGWGYLWLHVSRSERVLFIGERFSVTPGRQSIGYTLLTYPDGTRRSFAHSSSSIGNGVRQSRSGCRHWKPATKGIPFVADEMFALLDDVYAGRTQRPADYVAPWHR
jgi:hypothetical protein